MRRVLVYLPVSPWSEKARWALDHHGVEYELLEHVPMLYEPLLRAWARDLRTRFTVPALFEGSRVLRDSRAIAARAEELGRGAALFPREHDAQIAEWDELAERVMRAGRARAMERLVESPAALAEALPPPLRGAGEALSPVAKIGSLFLMRKHRTRGIPPAETEAAMTAGLERADAALSRADYLAGPSFTFADIAMAGALGFVAPHARVAMGPATRVVFSEPRIAAAFPRLVAARGRLVERHR